MDQRQRLLTVNEVAELVGLQPMAVYCGPLRRQLPWIELGNGRLRLRPADLEKYLSAHQTSASAPKPLNLPKSNTRTEEK